MQELSDSETLELGVKSANLASFIGLTQLASAIIGGVTLIVIARLLGPTQYGIYTLAYSVSAFLSYFSAFGLPAYLHKYIPSLTARKKKKYLSELLGAALLVSLVGGAVVFLVGAAFSGIISSYVFHNTSYVTLIIVSVFSIISTGLMSLEYNALIGFKDGLGSLVTYVSGSLSMTAIGIALVYLGYGPLGAILGILAGSIVGVLVGLAIILRHSRISVDLKNFGERVRHAVSFSMPIAGANIAIGVMNNFSILFLGAFSTAAIIGSFGVAYRIGSMVSTVIAVISGTLIQMFSSALESKKSSMKIGGLYNYSIYFGVLIAAPMAVFLIALPHAFVTSIFPSYTSSQFYTPFLVLGLLIGITGSYASAVTISVGRVRKVLKYAAITAAVQLVALLLLVPGLNAYGVILGMFFIGSLVSDFLYARYLKRELGISTSLGKVYRILGANIVLGILLFPINLLQVSETAQLLVGLVVIVAVYPLLLGVFGAFGRKEISIVRAIGASMPLVGGMVGALLSYASIFVR